MSGIIGFATADLHWPEVHRRGPWADMPEISGDVEIALKQVVDLCKTNNADLYMAGDNFDGPDVEPDSLAAAYRIFNSFKGTDLTIFYVLGNHDRGRDWLAPLGTMAYRLDPLPCIGYARRGLSVSGVDNLPNDTFLDRMSGSVDWGDIGLYHQSFSEWCGGAGGRGLNLQVLPNHKLAICGDTHVRGVRIRHENGMGPDVALSPGPIVPQSTTEFTPPCVWAIHEDLTIKDVYLQGRSFYRFDVGTTDEADLVLQKCVKIHRSTSLHDDIASPMVSIKVTVPIKGFSDVVRKMAGNHGFVVRISEQVPRPTSQAVQPHAGYSLADAVWSFPNPEPVRNLAMAAIAPGADPMKVFEHDAQVESAGAL